MFWKPARKKARDSSVAAAKISAARAVSRQERLTPTAP